MPDTDYGRADHRVHVVLAEAWSILYPIPDFTKLDFGELDYLQHCDAPGLPSAAHSALIAEIGRRYDATEPCPTCGVKNPIGDGELKSTDDHYQDVPDE